jgi:nucleotidyltransferase AbiEii toxin of type IV toxin-antitoxin system
MVYFENINLQSRIRRYLVTGFIQREAEILVLLEECAAGLFAAFPDRFVLFGGAALVLFFESPRLSRDLDLLARTGDLPEVGEIKAAIRHSIQSLSETFGLGNLEFRSGPASPKDVIKIWVYSNERPLFTVDLTPHGRGSSEHRRGSKQDSGFRPEDHYTDRRHAAFSKM